MRMRLLDLQEAHNRSSLSAGPEGMSLLCFQVWGDNNARRGGSDSSPRVLVCWETVISSYLIHWEQKQGSRGPRAPKITSWASERKGLRHRADSRPATCKPRASSPRTGSYSPLRHNLKMSAEGSVGLENYDAYTIESYTAVKIMRQLCVHWLRIISKLCCLAKKQNAKQCVQSFLKGSI